MDKYAMRNVFICYGDLKIGSIVICCLHLIGSVFFLTRLTTSLEDPDCGLLTLSVLIVLMYLICCDVTLFRALELEQPNNMLSWLILNGSISFNGIWFYCGLAYSHTIMALIIAALFCIYFYCVVVVFSYYWYLKYDTD